MNLTDILKKKFPEGFHGGQCVVWLREIFNQPAMGIDPKGNDVNLKFAFVKANGCIAANIAETYKGFRIGDCIFTTEGASKNWLGQWKGAGHEACIVGFDKDSLVLAESNFNLDKKVRYGRRLKMNSPYIIGIYRPSFKIDLELPTLELNYDVFINHQHQWNLKVLDETSDLIYKYTNGKLKVNFSPLNTDFQNWDYEAFPFNGTVYTVIKRSYLEETVLPLSFSSHNAPADIAALIVNPLQWQGTVSTGQEEIAWSSLGKPRLVQASCGEQQMSPWYGMKRITHILIHELGHHLAYINGLNDRTDIEDNQNHNLEGLFNVDWDRIALNL